MTYHLAAVAESQAANGLTNFNWVADEAIGATAAEDWRVRAGYEHILGIIAGSTNIAAARLVASSLRSMWLGGGPDISPLTPSTEPAGGTTAGLSTWIDWRRHPLRLLPRDEILNVQIDNGNNAEVSWALLALGSGPIAPADDVPWRTIKATTAASALTANAWTNRAITLAQALSPGWYGVGVPRAISTSGRGVRLVGLRPQPSDAALTMVQRPGGFCFDSETDRVEAGHALSPGGMGILGYFHTTDLPSIDIFAAAADNEVQEVYLPIFRAGGSR